MRHKLLILLPLLALSLLLSVLFSDPVLHAQPAPSTPQHPIERRVNLKLVKAPLPAVFDEISRQSQLRFEWTSDFSSCTVTAIFNGVTAREILQIMLEVQSLTYLHMGRSDTYTVSAREGGPVCIQIPPAHKATGTCTSGKDSPISLKCKDAPLSDFVGIVSSQSNAQFFLHGGADDYPVSARLKKASLEKAMEKVSKDESLSVLHLGRKSRAYTISPRKRP